MLCLISYSNAIGSRFSQSLTGWNSPQTRANSATSEPNVRLTSISTVGQTLHFGWKWKSGWRQNPSSNWHQSPTLERVAFWLKMKIGLTSEPNVRLTSEPIIKLTSISNVGQTLHFGWKLKLGWCQNPTSNWHQSLTLDRCCILVENEKCNIYPTLEVDVNLTLSSDVNLIFVSLQRWTNIAFWLKMKIGLTSEPKVKLTSTSNIGQTLHYIPIETGHYHICHQTVNTKGRGVKCPNN